MILGLCKGGCGHADVLLAARGCDIGSGGAAAGRRRGGKNDNVKGRHCSATWRRGPSVSHSPRSRGSHELAMVCCAVGAGRVVLGEASGSASDSTPKVSLSKSPHCLGYLHPTTPATPTPQPFSCIQVSPTLLSILFSSSSSLFPLILGYNEAARRAAIPLGFCGVDASSQHHLHVPKPSAGWPRLTEKHL